MKSKIIIHEKRVKIYFRQGDHFVRYNTKIPALSKAEFFRSNPENLFNPINSTYREYNKKIRELQEIIEEMIEENLGRFNVVINNTFIRNRLNTSDNKNHSKKFLVEYYKDFLNFKRSFFIEDNLSITSLRDYNSLFQALIDFQLVQKKLYTINSISNTWIKDFLDFLTQKHLRIINYENVPDEMIEILKGIYAKNEERKKRYRFNDNYIRIITKGELCDNTLNKRMDCLFQFFRHLKNIHVIKTDFDVSKFRKKYKRYSIEFSTLTFEEIAILQEFDINFDYKDRRYEYVKDVFVFMCFTSLRYSDVCTLKNRNIDTNGKSIDKIMQKTKRFKSRATIPLNKVTKEILEKYNYKLDRYCNVLYNRYLIEFFQKAGLFQEDFIPIKYVGGKEIECEPIPRYKVLTSHAGRRTCITNLINLGYNPLQIMPVSGHKSVKMLAKYHDKHRNKGIEAIKMVNRYDQAVRSSKDVKQN